jgi:hypothetical protein
VLGINWKEKSDYRKSQTQENLAAFVNEFQYDSLAFNECGFEPELNRGRKSSSDWIVRL